MMFHLCHQFTFNTLSRWIVTSRYAFLWIVTSRSVDMDQRQKLASVCRLDMDFLWGMLKAPPLNPRDHISRASKISPREGREYVRKSSKNSKKVDNGLLPIKKVDKDYIVLINVKP